MTLIAGSDALFLDFDGTLAPLQDDPEAVHLASGIAEVLTTCAARLNGAVAILSGRDLDDLAARVPQTLARFGNHGLRAALPGQAPSPNDLSPPDGMTDVIADTIAPLRGVRMEPKGSIIAVHYRANPACGPALVHQLAEALSRFDDYKLQHGKMVIEAKPRTANKGICLTTAMKSAPFEGRRPVMIGDDSTDEDAFDAAQTLGGLAIKVGDGPTIANKRLSGVDDVHDLLRGFAANE